MSGIKQKRFTEIEAPATHAGALKISQVLEKEHRRRLGKNPTAKKIDQLRSIESAERSFKAVAGNYDFYGKFDSCLKKSGSQQGIGFPCGLLRESATCLMCRFRARVHTFDMLSDRNYFSPATLFLTIADTSKAFDYGSLCEHNLRAFKQRVFNIIDKFGSDIYAFGTFEAAPLNASSWSPHWHILIDGPGKEAFSNACRNEFEFDPSVDFHKAGAEREHREDPLNFWHMLAYTTKSPFARRQWKPPLTGLRRLEHDMFVDQFSCSDLILKSKNIRYSKDRLITLSSLTDIATAQIRASSFGIKFDHVLLRKVGLQSASERQEARNIAAKLDMLNMLNWRESPLLTDQQPLRFPPERSLGLLWARLRTRDRGWAMI
jgi:hypothetical protein